MEDVICIARSANPQDNGPFPAVGRPEDFPPALSSVVPVSTGTTPAAPLMDVSI